MPERSSSLETDTVQGKGTQWKKKMSHSPHDFYLPIVFFSVAFNLINIYICLVENNTESNLFLKILIPNPLLIKCMYLFRVYGCVNDMQFNGY